MAAKLHYGHITVELNNVSYDLDLDNRFATAFGYDFSHYFPKNENKPLEFWKAQLAFRGYSSRGSVIEALKKRLRDADMTEMDPGVKEFLSKKAKEAINEEIRRNIARLEQELRESEQRQAANRARLEKEEEEERVEEQQRQATIRVRQARERQEAQARLVEEGRQEAQQRQATISARATQPQRETISARATQPQRETISTFHNGCQFSYHIPTQTFSNMGIDFEPDISITEKHPLQWWRVQLMFRGLSIDGRLDDYKQRLRNANIRDIDPSLKQVLMAWVRVKTKKRRASESPEREQRAGRSAPRRSAQRVFVRNRQADEEPLAFLLKCFFDEDGNTINDEPIELEHMSSGARAHLHQAAGSLKLFHKTAYSAERGSVMVIGGGKRGQERARQLERGESEEEAEIEPESDKEQDEDEIWDINGTWELDCESMDEIFGQSDPYTLEITTSNDRRGKEIYGTFDLGTFKGIIRFCNTNPTQPQHQFRRKEDFFLDSDAGPSAENPKMYYRWRGKETGEDVIQLREDDTVYKMTFEEGGTVMYGTWGTTECDPGKVKIHGVKVRPTSNIEGMDVEHKWGKLDEAAYDRENRDRWRR